MCSAPRLGRRHLRVGLGPVVVGRTALGTPRLLLHSGDGRSRDVEPGSGQSLRHLQLADVGGELVQARDDLGHEGGEGVDGGLSLEKRVVAAFVASLRPVLDGLRGELKASCGLGGGPGSSGAEAQDVEALDRRVMRSSLGGDSGHACVFEAELRGDQRDLGLELHDPRGQLHPAQRRVPAPGFGVDEGEVGGGDDVGQGCLGAAGPSLRQLGGVRGAGRAWGPHARSRRPCGAGVKFWGGRASVGPWGWARDRMAQVR